MKEHIVRKITRTHTFYVYGEKPHSSNQAYWDRDVRQSRISEIELGKPKEVVVEEWHVASEPEEALINHINTGVDN